jgi:S-adenosylmethionine synthetase
MAGFNMVVNVGEIACRNFETVGTEKIARDTVKDIGYECAELCFCHDSFEYMSRIHGQSPDISKGVTASEGLYEEQGAGDQVMMFGYQRHGVLKMRLHNQGTCAIAYPDTATQRAFFLRPALVNRRLT